MSSNPPEAETDELLSRLRPLETLACIYYYGGKASIHQLHACLDEESENKGRICFRNQLQLYQPPFFFWFLAGFMSFVSILGAMAIDMSSWNSSLQA